MTSVDFANGLAEHAAYIPNAPERGSGDDAPSAGESFGARAGSEVAPWGGGHADCAEKVRTLQQQLVEVRDDERRSIASTLHDTTLQLLTVAGLGADRARNQLGGDTDTQAILTEVRQQIADAQRQISDLTYMIYPRSSGDVGLGDALHDICAGFARRTNLSIILEPSEDWGGPPRETATVIIRLVQEALVNVYKHADATTVRVRLIKDGDILRLSIADDGKGFHCDRVEGTTGIGLKSCRDRIEAIGGTLEISTSPRGSIIMVNLP